MKTSYKELTVEDLKNVEGDGPRDLIAALCGVKAAALALVSTDDVLALYEIARFVEEPDDIAADLLPGDEIPVPDIPAEPWQKVELARKQLAAMKSNARRLPELVRIFYGPEYLTGRAAPCMALGAAILHRLVTFLERFKDLSAESPSEDQVEAGITALHSFGPYAIADRLGEKYGVRPYEIFDWTAEEVFLALLFDQAKNKYSENYAYITRRKTNPPKK